MDRNLKLALIIEAQTQGAKRELQALGAAIKPITVPVSFDASGLTASLNAAQGQVASSPIKPIADTSQIDAAIAKVQQLQSAIAKGAGSSLEINATVNESAQKSNAEIVGRIIAEQVATATRDAVSSVRVGPNPLVGLLTGAISTVARGYTEEIGREIFRGSSRNTRSSLRRFGGVVDTVQSKTTQYVQGQVANRAVRLAGFANFEDLESAVNRFNPAVFVQPFIDASKEARKEAVVAAAEGEGAGKAFYQAFKGAIFDEIRSNKEVDQFRREAIARTVAGGVNLAGPARDFRRDVNIYKAYQDAQNVDVEFTQAELDSIYRAKDQLVVGNAGFFALAGGESGRVLAPNVRKYFGQEFVGVENPTASALIRGESLPQELIDRLTDPNVLGAIQNFGKQLEKVSPEIGGALQRVTPENVQRTLFDALSSAGQETRFQMVSVMQEILGGINQDLTEQIAKIQAIQKLRPDLDIKYLGFSGGGFYGDELTRALGIKSVGIGTPFYRDPATSVVRGGADSQFQLLYTEDYLQRFQNENIADFEGAGLAHQLANYLNRPEIRQFINDELGLGLSEEEVRSLGVASKEITKEKQRSVRATVQGMQQLVEATGNISDYANFFDNIEFFRLSPQEVEGALTQFFKNANNLMSEFSNTTGDVQLDQARAQLLQLTQQYEELTFQASDRPRQVKELLQDYFTQYLPIAEDIITGPAATDEERRLGQLRGDRASTQKDLQIYQDNLQVLETDGGSFRDLRDTRAAVDYLERYLAQADEQIAELEKTVVAQREARKATEGTAMQSQEILQLEAQRNQIAAELRRKEEFVAKLNRQNAPSTLVDLNQQQVSTLRDQLSEIEDQLTAARESAAMMKAGVKLDERIVAVQQQLAQLQAERKNAAEALAKKEKFVSDLQKRNAPQGILDLNAGAVEELRGNVDELDGLIAQAQDYIRQIAIETGAIDEEALSRQRIQALLKERAEIQEELAAKERLLSRLEQKATSQGLVDIQRERIEALRGQIGAIEDAIRLEDRTGTALGEVANAVDQEAEASKLKAELAQKRAELEQSLLTKERILEGTRKRSPGSALVSLQEQQVEGIKREIAAIDRQVAAAEQTADTVEDRAALEKRLAIAERMLSDAKRFNGPGDKFVRLKEQEVEELQRKIAALSDQTQEAEQQADAQEETTAAIVKAETQTKGVAKVVETVADGVRKTQQAWVSFAENVQAAEKSTLDLISAGRGDALKQALQLAAPVYANRALNAAGKGVVGGLQLAGKGTAAGYGLLQGGEQALFSALPILAQGKRDLQNYALPAAAFAGASALLPGFAPAVFGAGHLGGAALAGAIGAKGIGGAAINALLPQIGSGVAAFGAGRALTSVPQGAFNVLAPAPVKEAFASVEQKQIKSYVEQQTQKFLANQVQVEYQALPGGGSPVATLPPAIKALGEAVDSAQISVGKAQKRFDGLAESAQNSGSIFGKAQKKFGELAKSALEFGSILPKTDPKYATLNLSFAEIQQLQQRYVQELQRQVARVQSTGGDRVQSGIEALRSLRVAEASKAQVKNQIAEARTSGEITGREQQSLSGGLSAFPREAKAAKSYLQQIAKEYRKSAYDLGIFIQEGLAQGLNQSEAEKYAREMAEQVIAAAKNEFGIQSPSKVFKAIGAFLDQGLGLGISGGKKAVESANNLADQVVATVENRLEKGVRYANLSVGEATRQAERVGLEADPSAGAFPLAQRAFTNGTTNQTRFDLPQDLQPYQKAIFTPFSGTDTGFEFDPKAPVSQVLEKAQEVAQKAGDLAEEYQVLSSALDSFPLTVEKGGFTPFTGEDTAIPFTPQTKVGDLQRQVEDQGLSYGDGVELASAQSSFPFSTQSDRYTFLELNRLREEEERLRRQSQDQLFYVPTPDPKPRPALFVPPAQPTTDSAYKTPYAPSDLSQFYAKGDPIPRTVDPVDQISKGKAYAPDIQKGGEEADKAAKKVKTLEERTEQAEKALVDFGKAAKKGLGQLIGDRNVDRLAKSFGDLAKQDRPVNAFFDRLAKTSGVAARGLQFVVGNIGNLIKGAIGFYVIDQAGEQLFRFGKAAFETNQQLNRYRNTLGFVLGDQRKGSEEFAFARAEAERLNIPLNVAVDGYTQIVGALKGTRQEGGKAREIFSGLAQTIKAYNLTQEQSASLTTQLGQAFRKQRLQAEEAVIVAEAGIPIYQLLQETLGIGALELADRFQKGEVSADDLGDALIRLRDNTANAVGDPALNSINAFGNQLTTLKDDLGGAIAPAVATFFTLLGNGLTLVREVVSGLEPVFSLLGKTINLILFPLKLVSEAFGFYLELIGKVIPLTVVLRGAFVALALLITTALVPATLAWGTALLALAVNTIPAMIGSMTALVAANPALLAAIVAIAAAAAIAKPALDGLSTALDGVNLKANESAIAFNEKYQAALDQLNKGVPVTKGQLDELKDGFQANVESGKDTQEVANALVKNLEKLQQQTEANAKAQKALNLEIDESAKSFEQATHSIESALLDRQLAIAESEADAAEAGTRNAEKYNTQRLEAEQDQSENLIQLYQDRADEIRSQLAESERLGAAGLSEAEQNTRREATEGLQKELLEIEAKGKQARIQFAQKTVEGITQTETKAAETIASAYDETGREIAANVVAHQSTVQEALNSHQISAAKSAEVLAAIDTDRIDAEIARERQKLKTLSDLPKTQDPAKIAERLNTEKELNDNISKLQLDRLKADQSFAEARDAVLAYDLRQLQEQLEDSNALIEQAQVARLIDEENLASRLTLNEEQKSDRLLSLERDRLAKQYLAQKEFVADLESLEAPNDPEAQAERQRQIREATQKTSDLALELLKNEAAQNDRLKQKIQDRLNTQIELAEKANSAESEVFAAYERSLQRQQRLSQQSFDLSQSQVNLAQTELDIKIEQQQDEGKRKKLEAERAELQKQSLLDQQELARQNLEIELQQSQIAAKRQQFEAQITGLKARQSQIQAEIELQDALRSQDQDRIENAQTLLALTRAQVASAELLNQEAAIAIGAESDRATSAREALANNQEAERLRLQFEANKIEGNIDKKVEDFAPKKLEPKPSASTPIAEMLKQIAPVRLFAADRVDQSLAQLSNKMVAPLEMAVGYQQQAVQQSKELVRVSKDLLSQLQLANGGINTIADRRPIKIMPQPAAALGQGLGQLSGLNI